MSSVSNAKDNFYFLLSHLLFDKTLKIQESYHTEVLPRNHLHASSPKIQVFGSWMQMKWVTPLPSSWRSSCTFWEKKSHCENWYRNREGEREWGRKEGEKEGRQWGAQTMLGSFVWLQLPARQIACGLQNWVAVSSNTYQLHRSPNLFFPSSQENFI